MITLKQFKDVCDTIVKAIGKERQIFHISSGAKLEAVAFPYQPSPVIYLSNDRRITHDNLGEFEQDFTSVEKALESFGYQETRTLLDDENVANIQWPSSIEEFKKKADDLMETPLKFAEEFFCKFEGDDKCMHKQCPECGGSGTKINGGVCVHHISCPCSLCTPH